MNRILARHGDHEVEATIDRENDRIHITIGDKTHTFTVHGHGGGRIQLEHAGRPHIVEVDGTDVLVDGTPYTLDIRKAPPNVPGATRAAGGSGGITKVKPPMPGKVIQVSVQPGDKVQAGDLLVVLEAMKMQNEIVAPVEGTIKSLGVAEGDSIDAKRIIAEIE